MTSGKRTIVFCLFFLSGFCGLVYQVVWTRMAFACFGIITPVLSVVLSMFMLGLALGSWAGGNWIGSMVQKARISAVYFYGLAELVIGLGAFAVPWLFRVGSALLLQTGESNSTSYLFGSAVVLACSILPWCLCMGVTFPWMMAYLRENDPQSRESFSYLYLANVLGAMSGTLLTAFVLVELFGFHDTLRVAAAANFLIAGLSFWLGAQSQAARNSAPAATIAPSPEVPAPNPQPPNAAALLTGGEERRIKWLLFTTGFVSMALEVVWTRAFTPILKTQVYSFALIVAVYLGATFLGSWFYRAQLKQSKPRAMAEILGFLCLAILLPVVVNDTRFLHPDVASIQKWSSVLGLLASICPFCGLLGYLTPALIDRLAAGAPAKAGSAYALNVLGCILGPLFAGYLLLPCLNERFGQMLLALPLLACFARLCPTLPQKRQRVFGVAAGAMLIWAGGFSQTFEDELVRAFPSAQVRRDHTASVVAIHTEQRSLLLVNGIGMTFLTPITKFMVHLPMAFHKGPPQSALVICFGMGTAFRSALSWDVPTTAVELVPSVTESFNVFHADTAQCLSDTNAHIVIDDGRRFLERTRQQFDIITLDPPPPPEAAGSSLLYSEEFYQLAKKRLNPGGILQMWLVNAEEATIVAELRAAHNCFPYVRCFAGMGNVGLHVLASMQPIESLTAAELAGRLPPKAQADLLEWAPGAKAATYLGGMLGRELPFDPILARRPGACVVDDLPYNEYFLLRRLGWL